MMSSENLKYIYHLPYHVRKKLCTVLDVNDKWEELGGMHMELDNACLYHIGQAVKRKSSPTNELLQLWETYNHTIEELFILLSRMQHYQAMSILKPYVDPKYHKLIFEGEENLSRLLLADKCENIAPHLQQGYTETNEKKNLDLDGNLNIQKETGVKDKLCLPKTENKISNNNDQAANIEVPKKTTDLSAASFAAEACTPCVPYKELEIATNNWNSSNILGRGGFGTVFVGTWKSTKVAIKRLEPHKSLGKGANLELQKQLSYRELKYLNDCRHDNILALFAFSTDGDRFCLVYQYMLNGSLEDRLLCRQNTKPLTWSQRYNIARGTALGLQFLHDRKPPLIHGDIKSANILLDKSFEPKIGDFGLTQEGPLQHYTSVKVSKVHGTKAYLPEEFFRGKKFSVKVDVYSFGVVLFEIATGLRAYDDKRPQKLLRDFVHEYDKSKLHELLDHKAETDELKASTGFLQLGLICTHYSAKQRLEMFTVLTQIDAIIATQKITSRAQQNLHLMQMNTFTPSNPYEMQLMHDFLRQQHRLSIPSPSPSTRSSSPGTVNAPQRRSSSPAKLTHVQGTIFEEAAPLKPDDGVSMPTNMLLQRRTITPPNTNASLQRKSGVASMEQSPRMPLSVTVDSSLSQNSSVPASNLPASSLPTSSPLVASIPASSLPTISHPASSLPAFSLPASSGSIQKSEPPVSSENQAPVSSDIEAKSLPSSSLPSIVVNQLQSNQSIAIEPKDLLPITSISTLYSSSDEISSIIEPESDSAGALPPVYETDESNRGSENHTGIDKSNEIIPLISALLNSEEDMELQS
ncbi:unnamed protein product [Bemisia tabaci]|uniref:non-specific serine/threonine protein kinase n=1 Tax=Bemisia tabaci TaxID=7038 RepID=A0A9P0AFE0_BEMTA|nr:unnamed protein product [Bemisia tabaci]